MSPKNPGALGEVNQREFKAPQGEMTVGGSLLTRCCDAAIGTLDPFQTTCVLENYCGLCLCFS